MLIRQKPLLQLCHCLYIIVHALFVVSITNHEVFGYIFPFARFNFHGQCLLIKVHFIHEYLISVVLYSQLTIGLTVLILLTIRSNYSLLKCINVNL